MKNSKYQISKAVACLMVLLSLAACAPGDKGSTPIRTGSTVRTTSGLPTQQIAHNGIQLNGIVYAEASYQSQFQTAVVGFMSASVPEDYVGYVSAQGQNNTGFYIGGYVPLANGSLRTANASQMQISTSAQLIVQVYDYFQNQDDLGALPQVVFSRAQGTVNGNSAQIQFSDDYGTVTMNGQFDQNRFTGTFSYDNRVHSENEQPHAGTIGTFEVPTCQFFVCN